MVRSIHVWEKSENAHMESAKRIIRFLFLVTLKSDKSVILTCEMKTHLKHWTADDDWTAVLLFLVTEEFWCRSSVSSSAEVNVMVLWESHSERFETLLREISLQNATRGNPEPSTTCQPLLCRVSGLHYNTSNTRSRRGYTGCCGELQKRLSIITPLLGQRKLEWAVPVSAHSG